MKRFLTYLFLTMLTGSLIAFGQSSTLIISEDFQDWDPTEDTDLTDCEAGLIHETENTRQMELTIVGGTIDIDVTLIKAGVSPDCDTKRAERDGTESTEGVTVGYVSLSKIVEETDTIGQFIFGPIAQIDSIRFGHSATGSNRGIRIYKSSDGETWERATEDEFYDATDSQAGDVNSVVIDATDVYIKFTSGIKSDGSSQHSRLHNIDVWGIPGVIEVNAINAQSKNSLNVYSIGGDLFNVEGEYAALQVINITGVVVYSQINLNNNMIDLSANPPGIYMVRAKDKSGQLFAKKIFLVK
jgi:hypothetical protein